MPILGICSLQAIGDDSRHVASLTFYPVICRAESFSTAETPISFIVYFFVCMYVCTYIQVHFNPSPTSPSDPTQNTPLHIIITFPQGSFPPFENLSFHSIPLPICACRAFSSFRLARLYLYPVAQLRPIDSSVYIRKKWVYKLKPTEYSVLFIQQHS